MTIDKVRAALERADVMIYGSHHDNEQLKTALACIKEALSELEGMVLVDFGLLSEACSAVLLAREECRGNEYWYKTYDDTLKKLEDAAMIAPYVKGE